MASTNRDPIKIELLKNALTAIADEMAVTMVRTARSLPIKESLDFSTGLLTADGALIAQGLCLPLHMGSFPPTMASILDQYEGNILQVTCLRPMIPTSAVARICRTSMCMLQSL